MRQRMQMLSVLLKKAQLFLLAMTLKILVMQALLLFQQQLKEIILNLSQLGKSACLL